MWAWLDLRVVALRTGAKYANLATYCVLSAKAPSAAKRVKVLAHDDVLFAARITLPLGDLLKTLQAIEAGTLRIGDTAIEYESTNSSAPHRACEFNNFRVHRIDRSFSGFASPWSGYLLETYGGNANALVYRIPGEWRSMDASLRNLPWFADDLGDLVAGVTGLRGWINASTLVGVRFFAPLEARFDPTATALARGEANVCVLAGSIPALRAATLTISRVDDENGIILASRTKIERFAARETSAGHDGVRRVERRKHVPNARAVQFELRVGGEPVQVLKRADYVSSNEDVRIAVYRALDPDLEVLRKRFHASRKESDYFESTVGRVLTMCGFHVDVLGDKKLSDGVDIIAHDPWEKRALALECTTGALNAAGKMDKFMLRLAELRRATPRVEIIGAIATSKPMRDHAPDALDAAGKNRLIVLGPDELEALLKLALRGATLTDALLRIRQSVPAQLKRGVL